MNATNEVKHEDHVAVEALWQDCAEGACEHDEDSCPFYEFETCVDCMVEAGYGRDPELWDDRPLMPWPHPEGPSS